MNEHIKQFCKKHNLTEDQFYGREKIEGSLFLNGLTSIPAGFNPTVGESLFLNGLTSIPAGFNPTVGWSLYLNGLASIPAGFNPTVGWSLYLDGLTSIPAGFNPIVGENLFLDGLTSIPAGFNPTVGWSLYLNGLTSIPAGFNPTVGWSLYLNGLTSIPAGFNPTVGEDLFLNGLTSIPAGFNPIVGENLFLDGLTSIPAGFNPIVGENLYFSGTMHSKAALPENYIFSWQNGRYIKADGIFAEVLSKKKNIYRLRKIGEQERFYMIVSDDGRIAHGETVEEAREDLIYKITDRNKSDYENLTLDDELTFEEAIICYRTITGACSLGVKDFVRTRLDAKLLKGRKEKYPIREIIEVTTGEYGGGMFREFFVKG